MKRFNMPSELIIDSSILACWRMNGNLLDSSTRGYTLNPSGIPAYKNGILNQCVIADNKNFSYNGDALTFDSPQGGNFTLSSWFNLTTDFSGFFTYLVPVSVSHDWVELKHAGINFRNTSSGVYGIRGSRDYNNVVHDLGYTDVNLSSRTWNNAMLTFDGTILTVYYNGQEIKHTSTTGTGTTTGYTGYRLNTDNIGGNIKDCKIDETFVANRCWSPDEIKFYVDAQNTIFSITMTPGI